jgi:hypothetical protein
MSRGAVLAPDDAPARIEPWHERLLRNGNVMNERIFMQAEIDDLRAALAAQVAMVEPINSPARVSADAPPQMAPRDAVPIAVALWDTEEIAMYLRRSINRVRSDIVCLPTFPRPIRLPVHGKSQALYKAREVVAWAESHTS